MKTKIASIDNLIPNGIEKDKINIIGSKAGFGKTTIVLNIMLNRAIEGDKVVLITTDSITYVNRLLDNIICNGRDEENYKVKQILDNINGKIVLKAVPRGSGIDEIYKVIRGEGYDLIIIEDIEHLMKSKVDNYIPFMSQLYELNQMVKSHIIYTTTIYDNYTVDEKVMRTPIKQNIDKDLTNTLMLKTYDSNNKIKIGGLYHNNVLKGSITFDYKNFSIR